MVNKVLPALAAAVLLLLLVASFPSPSTGAAPPQADQQCFPETGKCISGLFLQYWQANGGLRQQGLPITNEMLEVNLADGRNNLVQYFERARFEYHPENAGTPYQVLLGLVGSEQYASKYPGGGPPRAGGDTCFSETGRCLSGAFNRYWQSHGGLRQQGLPITDPFDEVNSTDGRRYRVQYLERARFELHPEFAGTENEVLLGLLGSEQFRGRYGNRRPDDPNGPKLWPDTAPEVFYSYGMLANGRNASVGTPWTDSIRSFAPSIKLLAIVYHAPGEGYAYAARQYIANSFSNRDLYDGIGDTRAFLDALMDRNSWASRRMNYLSTDKNGQVSAEYEIALFSSTLDAHLRLHANPMFANAQRSQLQYIVERYRAEQVTDQRVANWGFVEYIRQRGIRLW